MKRVHVGCTRFLKIVNRGGGARSDSLALLSSVAPGVYRHYKGALYYVLGLSKDSETEQEFVVYRPLYDTTWPHLWHRSVTMFCEQVVVDGVSVPRFARVSA